MKISKGKTPQEQVEEKIKIYLREFAEIREKRKEFKKEETWRQQDIVSFMKDAGRSTITTDYDGAQEVRGTLVTRSRITINEEKLKKELGAKQFNKLTERVLDEDKLEEAIKNDEVDPNIVAKCSEEKVSEYIRTTIDKKDPEEDE